MADNYYVDESHYFNLEKEVEDALEEELRKQIFRNDVVVHEQLEVLAFQNLLNSILQNGSNFSVSNYSRETPFAFCPDVAQCSHQGFDIPTSSSLADARYSSYEAIGQNPANCFFPPVASVGVDFGRPDENQSIPSVPWSNELSIALNNQRPAQEKRTGTEIFGAVGSSFREKGNEPAEFLFQKKTSSPFSECPPKMPVERSENEGTSRTDNMDWSSAHATFPPIHCNSSIGKTTDRMSPASAAGAETIPIAGPSTIQTESQRKGKKKPFKCAVCQKSFVYKSYLDTHYRTHTGENPFECSICGKGFAKNCTLMRHLRIHTGEKPFECKNCGKRFAQNCTLTRHLRIHTGEKPFECSICAMGFAQKGTLRAHLRIHTEEKNFNCDICEKRFARRQRLKRHLQTHAGK